jgi:hypothetical protein
MGELIKDRKIDISLYGNDPYINVHEERQRHKKDLKIFAKAGFNSKTNPFVDLSPSPATSLLEKFDSNKTISCIKENKQEKIQKYGRYLDAAGKRDIKRNYGDNRLIFSQERVVMCETKNNSNKRNISESKKFFESNPKNFRVVKAEKVPLTSPLKLIIADVENPKQLNKKLRFEFSSAASPKSNDCSHFGSHILKLHS